MIDLGVPQIAATLASGALVGFLLAVFGGGGSVLAAPLLLYTVGVRDPHVAIGTSSAAVAANAAFNPGRSLARRAREMAVRHHVRDRGSRRRLCGIEPRQAA